MMHTPMKSTDSLGAPLKAFRIARRVDGTRSSILGAGWVSVPAVSLASKFQSLF